MGFPATLTSGLGLLQVCGRKRDPKTGNRKNDIHRVPPYVNVIGVLEARIEHRSVLRLLRFRGEKRLQGFRHCGRHSATVADRRQCELVLAKTRRHRCPQQCIPKLPIAGKHGALPHPTGNRRPVHGCRTADRFRAAVLPVHPRVSIQPFGRCHPCRNETVRLSPACAAPTMILP